MTASPTLALTVARDELRAALLAGADTAPIRKRIASLEQSIADDRRKADARLVDEEADAAIETGHVAAALHAAALADVEARMSALAIPARTF
jgi:hypothetical protein